MDFINANIYTEEFSFRRGGFSVENGRFSDVLAHKETGEDMAGLYVIPGLIDIHNHGNSGADFSDGDYEGLVRMARYLAGVGVTSFAPATLTLPYEQLAKAYATGLKLKNEKPSGAARLIGAHMEGPFFSEKRKGAQNGDYLRAPDFDAFKQLYDGCEGLIRIVDVAPELEGATDFITKASALCTVSIAHTDADYRQARGAIDAGATHLTHLFNAMPPIHHRKPGVIGAASEDERVCAELICDGLHVHPSAVRMAFRLFGAERLCLVSDALRCCGMPDGKYMLGGQTAYLNGNVAKLADGTLAGSATNLFDCLKNAVAFGVDLCDAIRTVTWNPAHEAGVQEEVGSIADGKLADFIVCDSALNLKAVYLGGEQIV